MTAGLFDGESFGVLLADRNQRILSLDAAFLRMTGFRKEVLEQSTLPQLIELLSERDGELQYETVRLKNHDGQETFIAVIVQPANAMQELDAQIRYLAYHDPLTELPNRLCLHRCMEEILEKAHKDGQISAVLFLDLDRFKSINDTLGHAAGDQLLKEAARRIRSCLRAADRMARIGGDEFICVMAELAHEREAEAVAGRIVERLSEPFLLCGQELVVTASIGISLYPYHGDDLEALIANADTAMYQTKREGRSGYRMFSYEMNAMSFENMLLEQSLRRAVQQNELLLYYQPQVDVHLGRIIGLEALLRWQHPEFGIVPPAEFIPIAEETDLIVPLGEWTLRKACMQTKKWQDEGLPPLKVSVNVSAKQFQHPNFIPGLSAILEQTSLAPEWLELEITETIFIQDVQATVEKLNRLKQIGVRIAVDDFGTGYSSLGYLRKFPLDILKIDRSFIRDIEHNGNDRAITAALIRLAHELDMEVIAEGIETPEQLQCMKERQCDAAQGYLFSVPLPADEIVSWLTPAETEVEVKERD